MTLGFEAAGAVVNVWPIPKVVAAATAATKRHRLAQVKKGTVRIIARSGSEWNAAALRVHHFKYRTVLRFCRLISRGVIVVRHH